MKATIIFATEKFREFNRLMFEGKLPEVPILMSDSGRALGMLKYERKRNMQGRMVYSNFRIYLSRRYDLPQNQVEDTLIHEMIHLYIAYNNLKDTSMHGDRFKYHMNRINRMFNRNITISNKDKSINDTDSHACAHYICETLWHDGSRYITCCARTRIFEVNNQAMTNPGCVSIRWWFTLNPFFNRYPNSLKLKLYRISDEDYSAHIATATECVCANGVFRIKSQ